MNHDKDFETTERKEYGVCKFCGMAVPVPLDMMEMGFDEKSDYATLHCDCAEANSFQIATERAKRREETLERAREQIEQLFGGGASDFGFAPVSDGIGELLCDIAELIYDEEIKDTTVNVPGGIKAKLGITSKGVITVFRQKTTAYKREV